MTGHEPRLVLAQRPTRRDHLHGAWWPRSRDLDEELPLVLGMAVSRFGAVLGVMLNRDEWPDAEVIGRDTRLGRTKISFYGLSEANLAVLLCEQSRRLTLLLLPPSTPERVALTATLMACAPGNTLSTQQTLARARDEATD